MKVMGIYYIENSVNGKRYIGSSVDIKRRLAGHLNNLRKGKHVNVVLTRAWEKYGESAFTTGICEEVSVHSDLMAREQVWINRCGDYNLAPSAGSTLGFKQSEEFKVKQSARVRGKGNPMFGKSRPDVAEMMRRIHTGRTLSEDHKAKCSASLRGRSVGPMPDEVKAKIGSANRGKVRTEEHRQNMSMSQQKRPAISDLTREKLRVANTGRKHNQETKNKISRMKTGITLNLTDEERSRRAQRVKTNVSYEKRVETQRKLTEAKRGVHLSEEHKRKLSAATKGRPLSEDHRAKVSAANKSRVLTDEQRATRSKNIKAALAERKLRLRTT